MTEDLKRLLNKAKEEECMQNIFLPTIKAKEEELAPLFTALSESKKLSVFGMNRAHKTHVVASLEKTALFVVTDGLEAMKAVEGLQAFGVRALRFPEKEDTLFFKRSSSEGAYGRIKVLGEILSGEVDVVVSTPEALMAYTPDKNRFVESIITLRVDEDFGLDDLVKGLGVLGYQRAEYADQKGVFAVRGDIVDIFVPTEEKPYRVEFFGDTVERIRVIDERENLFYLRILPVTDILLSEEERASTIKRLSKVTGKGLSADANARLQEILADATLVLDSGAKDTGINWIIPFCSEYLGCLFDYLPEDRIVVYDECRLLSDRTDRLYAEHKNRVSGLVERGEVSFDHLKSVRARENLFDTEGTVLAFQQITTMNPIFTPTAVFSFKSTPIARYHLDRESLTGDLLNWQRNGYTVALCCRDLDGAKTVSEEMVERGVNALCDRFVAPDTITCTPWGIKNGFIYHQSGIVVIGEEELLRKKTKQVRIKKKDVFTIPEVGDYVVHDVHGIGVFKGTTRLKTDTHERDYVHIEYSDGQVYVPVDQMGMLSRYSGGAETPKLSKLGGKEFARLKDKVRQSVKEMAFDLLELYSKRENSKGVKYPPDTEFQTEFEDRFPHNPTEDQVTAVQEIKSDMEKGKVMDRLLCGDVGYGKTEVALRAVFKTVLEGYQVAILAPTTILAEQHYKTVLKRFEGYGLKIACLNRFHGEKETAKVLEAVESGQMNIVCGTHRILSKDVKFQNLGLLVLDEEQ